MIIKRKTKVFGEGITTVLSSSTTQGDPEVNAAIKADSMMTPQRILQMSNSLDHANGKDPMSVVRSVIR